MSKKLALVATMAMALILSTLVVGSSAHAETQPAGDEVTSQGGELAAPQALNDPAAVGDQLLDASTQAVIEGCGYLWSWPTPGPYCDIGQEGQRILVGGGVTIVATAMCRVGFFSCVIAQEIARRARDWLLRNGVCAGGDAMRVRGSRLAILPMTRPPS